MQTIQQNIAILPREKKELKEVFKIEKFRNLYEGPYFDKVAERIESDRAKAKKQGSFCLSDFASDVFIYTIATKKHCIRDKIDKKEIYGRMKEEKDKEGEEGIERKKELGKQADTELFNKTKHDEKRNDYPVVGVQYKEISHCVNSESVASQIYALFQSGQFELWSVDGISEELGGIEKAVVEEVLLADKQFRRSWLKTQDWRNLYTLSNKPVTWKERFAQFIANARGFHRPLEDPYAPDYT